MGKENEKDKGKKVTKDLPFEKRKGAEFHKPPDRDDNPPKPTPPPKKESDKDS